MKRSIYILLFCALALTACTKYLDIKPYGKTIPKTPDEFSSLLHAIIEEIDYGEEFIVGHVESVADLECYADNLEANLTQYPKGDFLPLYIGTDLSGKTRRYDCLYETIKDCNIILDNMEDRESELSKEVLGVAYSLRGICYYNLLRDFCEPPVGNMQGLGMPLVVRFDMEARIARSTIDQTFRQIESDMLKALEYNVQNKLYRITADVMEGYLARLYFWVGEWDKAAEYAGKVMTKHPMVTSAGYADMIKAELSARGNMILKSAILFDAVNQSQFSNTKDLVRSRPLSKGFVDLFVEKEKDVRYALTFDKWRLSLKNPFAGMRSAEMNLILMESLYHSGDKQAALAALNEFRRLRIEGVADYTMETLPEVQTDGLIAEDVYGNPLTPLLNAILNERRKELYMEGDRWYELKRNGRPEFWVAKQGRKYTTFSYMYTFPFRIQDVELVDGMIQNPGYDKVQ